MALPCLDEFCKALQDTDAHGLYSDLLRLLLKAIFHLQEEEEEDLSDEEDMDLEDQDNKGQSVLFGWKNVEEGSKACFEDLLCYKGKSKLLS